MSHYVLNLCGYYSGISQKLCPTPIGSGNSLPLLAAEDGFDTQSTTTGYTFWGRFSGDGSDNREPLPSVWAAEFSHRAESSTELLVWRDSTSTDVDEFYPCGSSGPAGLPLEETEVIAFDQQENAVELCYSSDGTVISLPPAASISGPCFDLETQRLSLDGDLAQPYREGWLALNLNFFDPNIATDIDFGSGGNIAQSHVTVVETTQGSRQVGYAATVLAHACDDLNPRISSTGVVPDFFGLIFADGFESGDTSAWQ